MKKEEKLLIFIFKKDNYKLMSFLTRHEADSLILSPTNNKKIYYHILKMRVFSSQKIFILSTA